MNNHKMSAQYTDGRHELYQSKLPKGVTSILYDAAASQKEAIEKEQSKLDEVDLWFSKLGVESSIIAEMKNKQKELIS